VTSESLVHIAEDNPVTAGFLDLLQFAAHPGDSFAWQHIQMTPFAAALEREGWSADDLVLAVLEEANRQGFERVVIAWHRRLIEAGVELDTFSARRLDELAAAARNFDSTGNRSIAGFLQFARNYAIREPSSQGVVQVMTIHKAKGLGFDVVLLPDLGGQALTTIRRELAVHRRPDRSVEWVMNLPQKDIARADGRLDFYHEEKETEACYEGLCTLYVAMTRAKRAMYVIADKVPKYARAANYPRMLEKTLGREGDDTQFGESPALAIFQSGDRHWCRDIETVDTEQRVTQVPQSSARSVVLPKSAGPSRRFRRRTPSGSETYALSASQLFSRSGERARKYGTAVHELFEQIDWYTDATPELLREYAERHRLERRAVAEVLDTLHTESVKSHLSQPEPDAQAWLEKRFEIILGGDWLSGTFDRVVIRSDGTAQILDFKTDTFPAGNPTDHDLVAKADVYQPQLVLYRRVLARMINIDEGSISCALLFTKARKIWTVLA